MPPDSARFGGGYSTNSRQGDYLKTLGQKYGIDGFKFDAGEGGYLEGTVNASRSIPAAFSGVKKMFTMRPPHITNIQRDMYPSMEAAKQAGVTQVVFLSLIGIEKAKYVPHYKVETYLQELGFQTTFLRCSFFMQNLNTTHRKEIKERSEIFVPVGKAKTSFIDARDIGKVAAAALTESGHAGNNYDLTGSEGLDYWQAAAIMSEVLGRKITYRNPNPLHFLIENNPARHAHHVRRGHARALHLHTLRHGRANYPRSGTPDWR